MTHTKGLRSAEIERDGGTEHLLHRTAGGRNLLLVPEDRQRNERNRDDPQNDVFAATFLFFLSHKRNTAYLKPQFQCRADFDVELRSYGLDAAVAEVVRLYPVNLTTSRT